MQSCESPFFKCTGKACGWLEWHWYRMLPTLGPVVWRHTPATDRLAWDHQASLWLTINFVWLFIFLFFMYLYVCVCIHVRVRGHLWVSFFSPIHTLILTRFLTLSGTCQFRLASRPRDLPNRSSQLCNYKRALPCLAFSFSMCSEGQTGFPCSQGKNFTDWAISLTSCEVSLHLSFVL